MHNSTFTKFSHLLLALVVCCLGVGNSWAKAAAAAEDQEPVFTITGDYRLNYYEPGKEYEIVIQVQNPSGQEVTLDLNPQEYSTSLWETEYSFSPELPLSGTGTLTTTLRLNPINDIQGNQSLALTATNAEGYSKDFNFDFLVSTYPKIYLPEEPFVIGIKQPFIIGLEWDGPVDAAYMYHTGNDPPDFGEFVMETFASYSEYDWATEEDIGTYLLSAGVTSYPIGSGPSGTFTLVVEDCAHKQWYVDADEDGYGSPTNLGPFICVAPKTKYAYVDNNLDCDDADSAVYPGAGGCEAEENQPPVISITGLEDYYLTGQEYTFTIEATDPEGGEIRLELEALGSEQAFWSIMSSTPALPLSGTGTVQAEITVMAETGSGSDAHPFNLHATDAEANKTSRFAEVQITDPTRFTPPADTIRIGVNQPFLIRIPYQASNDHHGSWADELPFGKATEDIHIWAGEGEEAAWPKEEHIGTYVVGLYALHNTGHIATDSVVIIVDPNCTNQELYRDADGDGYGVANPNWYPYEQQVCTDLQGYATNDQDCDDSDPNVYPGAGDCPAVENQAPTISLSGDVGLSQYEIGQEYTILVHVTDPEKDLVTLDLGVVQWFDDLDKIGHTKEDFHPDLPITQHAPYTVEIRFTSSEDYIRQNELEFTATDEAGNQASETTAVNFFHPFLLVVPSDPIHIPVGQEEFWINIPIENASEDYWPQVEVSSVPFDLNLERDYGSFFTLRTPEVLSEEHIGTYDILLTLQEGSYVHQATLRLVVEADCALQSWYPDRDGDGWGRDEDFSRIRSCNPITGYVNNNADCDDTNAEIYPGVGNCEGENQAPLFAIEGEPERIEVGQENVVRITATDPEGEALTLRLLQVYDHNFDEVDMFEGATLTPMLPQSGTGQVTTELRWTPSWTQYGWQEMHLLAEDAQGNQTRHTLQFWVLSTPIIYGPDHITVPANTIFELHIPVSGAGGTLWTSGRSDIPIQLFEASPGIHIVGELSEDYLGTQEVTLIAGLDGYELTTKPLQITVVEECQLQEWYPDADGDGYGFDSNFYRIDSCTPIEGYVTNRDDCDDADPTVYRGAEEIIGDGKDNNCNGAIDEGLCDVSEALTVASTCSDDPENYRSWIIYNPNHCAVEVRYDLRQSDVEGTLLALPGETIFSTPFIERNMNIMQIHWEDDAGREQMYRYREPANTGLRIFTICSDNPEEELRWRVHNPNPCPYYVEWEIEGSMQRGSYIAPPGDTYLTTTTIPDDPNVAVLMYYNYHSKKRYSRQASAYRTCYGNQEPDCTISQDLTIASSCSDDPFHYQNWVIYNPNSCAVKVRYDLRHTNQQASLMAAPGYTYISTPFIEGSRNIIDLHWQDSSGKDKRYRFREPANTGIRIFSECSDAPERELRWRVHNPNPCPYYVQWAIKGSMQKGAFVAPPGDSYFSSRPEAGANVAQISYYNYQSTRRTVTKGASYKRCQGGINTRLADEAQDGESLKLATELAVYPVPFRDLLQIRYEGIKADQPVRVALVSLNGTTLEINASQIRQSEGALELDLQQLPLADGLYLLRLDVGEDKPLYQRVIRQR